MSPENITPRKRTKQKKPRNKGARDPYNLYIYKVLKQVHPKSGISRKAMRVMNSFVRDTFNQLANEASALCRYNNTVTIGSREIQTAARLVLPGELSKHAVSEGTKAVTRFVSNMRGKQEDPDSESEELEDPEVMDTGTETPNSNDGPIDPYEL